MDSLTSGTFVGAGSFRCTHCDYTLTLDGSEALSACPSCGGKEFVRASLFSTERIPADRAPQQSGRRSDPAGTAAARPRAHTWRRRGS